MKILDWVENWEYIFFYKNKNRWKSFLFWTFQRNFHAGQIFGDFFIGSLAIFQMEWTMRLYWNGQLPLYIELDYYELLNYYERLLLYTRKLKALQILFIYV